MSRIVKAEVLSELSFVGIVRIKVEVLRVQFKNKKLKKFRKKHSNQFNHGKPRSQRGNTTFVTANSGKRLLEMRSCYKFSRVTHLAHVYRTSDYFMKMF